MFQTEECFMYTILAVMKQSILKLLCVADLCNHNKCWQYLIDSMKYPGTVIGTFARNYRTWKNYSKQQRLETVLELGKRHED